MPPLGVSCSLTALSLLEKASFSASLVKLITNSLPSYSHRYVAMVFVCFGVVTFFVVSKVFGTQLMCKVLFVFYSQNSMFIDVRQNIPGHALFIFDLHV